MTQIEKNKKTILTLLNKVSRPGMQELIEFIKKSDYFKAPASTKYHLSCEGGLAQHSLNVCKLFDKKCKDFKINITNESILLCGLLHDFCKVNFYLRKTKWVKTGDVWNEEEVWGFKETQPLGHGEKSVILLQNFIKLTLQEQVIIRWHMSIFELGESQRKYYYSGIEKFPECVLLFTADFESTHLLENINI